MVRSQHNRWIDREKAGKTGVVTERVNLHVFSRSLPGECPHKVAIKAKERKKARSAEVRMSWLGGAYIAASPKAGCPARRSYDLLSGARLKPIPPKGADGLEWILLANVATLALADALARIKW